MRYKKRTMITVLFVLLALTFLSANDSKEQWTKDLSQIELEALSENISGTVQVADNQLQLVQDSTNVIFNLIIPENMELEIEKIEIGERYLFSGRNSKNGFLVKKFILLAITEEEEEE